jgi:hypothetical protein
VVKVARENLGKEHLGTGGFGKEHLGTEGFGKEPLETGDFGKASLAWAVAYWAYRTSAVEERS